MAEVLAMMMRDFLVEELSDFDRLDNFKNPVLVPIPSDNSSKRKRGFNQAEHLAQKLAQTLGLEINISSLKKVKNTKRQAILKRKERIENVRDSFAVIDNKLIGRAVILIDDVYTTGATISEARRALREGGVKKIKAFTLAH